MRRKFLLFALGAVVLSGAATLVFQPMASASARPTNCPASRVCLYADTGFRDRIAAVPLSYLSNHHGRYLFRDFTLSSIYNGTNCGIRLQGNSYQNYGLAAPHKGYRSLGPNNDKPDRIVKAC